MIDCNLTTRPVSSSKVIPISHERSETLAQGQIPFTMWRGEGLYPAREPVQPSAKLAGAILRRALRDILIKETSSRGEPDSWQRDAVEWFSSDKTDPGSLTWVCDLLRLQPWMLHQWLSVYHRSDGPQREQMVRELFHTLRLS